ncbi:MAG: S8 family serine peptidase [Actinobacteria bacterium]|uniref:Unannotated protein n=1 Tax=freshwater metagenome TaxID=449393 RepID=A0A6J6PZZ1_9ZZZZ|nr:S8 family serine peptidase [Actinomycetota bacterium]
MSRSTTTRPSSVVRRLLGCVVLLALALGGLGVTPVQAAAPAAGTHLYLVTLDGPGTAGIRTPLLPLAVQELQLRAVQDRVLASIGAGSPVYRWTSALNGVAVELTRAQADALEADPAVDLVERNSLRRLASDGVITESAAAPSSRSRGGRGVVIGFVDSGLSSDNPVFASAPDLGPVPEGFDGRCSTDDEWGRGACNDKVVAGDWFVAGFGEDALRVSSSLSPRDDDGHGTQMASIAAGNAGVTVRVGAEDLGSYAGLAPQARIAVYKACWSAPDPHDDGCATADLVAAIDQATRDGVDVLNLSVSGPDDRLDTVERALLGAAEADVVVVAAAGNDGSSHFAAHPVPWVTTVGSTTGVVRRGQVRLGSSGPRLAGAMAAVRSVGPAPLVVGAHAAAPDATRADARICAPGSLDASRVHGAIVLCDRGGVGRVDKSAAVAQADGVGMVLVNLAPQSVDADFHTVPTVHLGRADGLVVRRWARRHPRQDVRLTPVGVERPDARMVRSSSAGNPSGAVLKPDLVAPGVGVLGAVPIAARGQRWDFVSGTSAATAYTSGGAATLLARHDWSAPWVRSALATTARAVANSDALHSGAGRVRPERARQPGLVYALPSIDYRAWLDGDVRDLNLPSIVLAGAASTITRTVTNVGRRALYFSSSTGGFRHHSAVVTPAAVRLAPGESATYTLTVSGPSLSDDGWVLWRGAHGTRTRIPVLLTR